MISKIFATIESKKNSKYLIYRFLYKIKRRLSVVFSKLDNLFLRLLFGNNIKVVNINNICARIFYFYSLCFKERLFDRKYIINFVKDRLIILPKFGSVFGEFEAVALYFKEYLPEMGDIVVDGGAHKGLFTIVLSLLVGKSGKVISFEPDLISFKKMLGNAEKYGLENVIFINKGLYSKSAKFPFSAKGILGSAISESKESGIEDALFVTIDSEIERLGIKKVNYIKMDIEGAEIEAVKGCGKILSKSDVHLAIASYHKVKGVETYYKLEDFFSKTNYFAKTEKSFHAITYVFKNEKNYC